MNDYEVSKRLKKKLQELNERKTLELISATSPQAIGCAICELQGNLLLSANIRIPNFGISYAQLNGYSGEDALPERLDEVVFLMLKEPSLSEASIEFAVQCLLQRLDAYVRDEERRGSNKRITVLDIIGDKEGKARCEHARDLLTQIRRVGEHDLKAGLEKMGFNIRQYLVETTVERRMHDIEMITQELDRRKSVLRPLFLRAYSGGRNKYGEIELDPLKLEAQDFLDRFLPEKNRRFFFQEPAVEFVMSFALDWVDESQTCEDQPENGIDFEHWCARKIEEQGWIVVVSKASGDQGVDVIANRDTVSVAVQCKRYSSPIGNKAVQEAFAGAKHYCADLAVVIGTGGFTKAAQDLASTTNVVLIDADMIADFTNQVFDNL